MKLSARLALLLALLASVYMGCFGRRRRVPLDDGTSQCPKIRVDRKSIIRTKASIANGARLLHKTEVDSARECYILCCKKEDCDTAIMHYDHYERRKMCYLFFCDSPSRCSFVSHDSYAVIRLIGGSKKEKKGEQAVTTTTLPTTIPLELATSTPKPAVTERRLPEEECPEGAPVAMCAADPCSVTPCEAFPNAMCQPSFCGGCFAHYYDKNMKRVNCKIPDKVAPIKKQKKTREESTTKDGTDSNVNEDLVVVSSADGGGLPTDDTNIDGEDPYAVKEYREWLDGAKKGHKKPIVHTTSAVKKVIFSNSTGREGYVIPGNEKPTGISKAAGPRMSFSVPLLVGMLGCVIILTAVVWRMRCNKIGKKGKKFAVDDGDYLINGMYL